MESVAIIQARMRSTRLPGKVLAKIGNKSMLWHVIERVRRARSAEDVIVATSVSPQDDILVKMCREYGVKVFIGSKDDVLQRYIEAAACTDANTIIRVTADNPLTDPNAIDEIVWAHKESRVDYTTMVDCPLGTSSEVVSFSALNKAHNWGNEKKYREHVTLFIKEHPEIFKILRIKPKPSLQRPDLRLTVDTEEDLKLVRKIYEILYREGEIVRLEDVTELLNREPELRKINAHVKQKVIR